MLQALIMQLLLLLVLAVLLAVAVVVQLGAGLLGHARLGHVPPQSTLHLTIASPRRVIESQP